MSQDGHAKLRDPDDLQSCLEGYETPDVAHYIHDMLASMESIAVRCEMNGLAQKLAAAKTEASQHFELD